MMRTMCCAGGAGLSDLLVALALGYIVLYFANREEKNLRSIGFAIGTVIIALAALFIVAKAYFKMTMKKGPCPIMLKYKPPVMMKR